VRLECNSTEPKFVRRAKNWWLSLSPLSGPRGWANPDEWLGRKQPQRLDLLSEAGEFELEAVIRFPVQLDCIGFRHSQDVVLDEFDHQ